MSMTSVVCNVPVLSQNDSTLSSFCLHDMKVTSLRYLDAKFHHPSLGASPPVAACALETSSEVACIVPSVILYYTLLILGHGVFFRHFS